MAELDDLFLALERADAAGNKADARELAKMIAIASGEIQPTPEPQVKQNTSNLGDIGTAFKQAAVGAGKSFTDVFGADNAASQYLGGVQERLGKEYTPQRIEEMQKRQQLIDEAHKSGITVDELQAYLGGVAEAPIQSIAQGLGSITPYAAMQLTPLGRMFKGVGLGAQGLNTAMGAIQGIGAIKGSIYDTVKSELEASGVSPEEASARASKAQEYSTENAGQFGLGAVLGGAAGRFGAENLLTPGIAARLNAKMIPRAATAAAAEAPFEGLQSGQQQLASNLALIREGYDIDPMQGVYGAAARDAAIGALTAAPIGAVHRGEVGAPAPVLEPTKREEPEEKEKQSDPNIYNPAVRESAPQIAETLLPEMRKFGLENVGLKIMDSIENGRADGMWANNVIHVALDKPNPMGSMRHESIHALKQLGGFQDNEWSALNNKAKSEWLKTFIKDTGKYEEYKKIYQQENKTLKGFEDYIHEEAIAEAFRYFDKNGAPEGLIGAIYEKLKLMFEALRNGFTGAGFQSADSIFRNLESGTRAQVAAPEGTVEGARFSQPDTRRIDMNFKDVTKRIPELTEAAKKVEAGEMTAEQYDQLVNRYKPITPYDFVPEPTPRALAEEGLAASDEKKIARYGKTEQIPEGHPVGLRLDIPAYTKKGAWVNTIHNEAKGEQKGAMPYSSMYSNISAVKNATFDVPQRMIKVATGEENKYPDAKIKGNWLPVSEEQIVAQAQAALNDPAWTQVGMDPERHGYFYDRKTTQPVLAADEVIQIGPLVLAKNAKFGSKKNFKYSLANAKKVQDAQFLDHEIQDLVKKVGNRIVGMKSDETLEDVKKAVKKLQQYTAEGIKGKDWYEKSAAAVLSAFHNDPVLAEKFFQIIAITSANTEVAANFTKAVKGWTQFAEGKPIKVGTENENKKVDALLNFGEDWGGRKTNTFYSNLMEAMEGKDTGRSTIDLHMTRMIFDKDAPTDAQYELAENMVRLLANKSGMIPRQVQAASWVTQKAKSMFDLYRQKGWKKNLSDKELMELTFEKAVGDYSHQMKARTQALPITEALREPSPSIKARTQNITGEIIPSVQTPMGQAEEMNFKFKEKITKQIANSNAIPDLVNALGINSKVKVTVGSGAYASKVNPNLIVKVISDNPEEAKRDALDLANAMSYVFKQDATPLFRADPKMLGQNQLGHKIKFDTADITPAQQKKMLAIFKKRFGEDAGFTKINNTELVAINYRGENGDPFLTTDEDFMKGLAEIKDDLSKVCPIESQEMFGAESEYPYHDWKAEPSGAGIVSRLQDSRRERPNLRQQLDNLGESFVSDLRNTVRESGATPRFSLSAPNTEEFNNWFRDSLAIDENGKPMVLYHGTSGEDFDTFKLSKEAVLGSGIYMTPKTDYANTYTGEGAAGGRMIPLFARVESPLVVEFDGKGDPARIALMELGVSEDKAEAIVEKAYEDKGGLTKELMVRAKNQGHDGIFLYRNGVLTEVVAFSPSQVKSVFNQKPYGGINRYSITAPDTKEFKQWFSGSKIVNPDGSPKVYYHGTARDITEFKPKQANAIFLTDNPVFAGQFSQLSENTMHRMDFEALPEKTQRSMIKKAITMARADKMITADRARQLTEINNRETLPADWYISSGLSDILEHMMGTESGQNIVPLFVKAKNPFDYQNKEHVEKVLESASLEERDKLRVASSYDSERLRKNIGFGSWVLIESPEFQSALKRAGFDAFYVSEGGNKNLAVYNPNQIKSFSNQAPTESADIRFSIALNALAPDTFLTSDKNPNALGNLGFMPVNSPFPKRPIRLQVGTKEDERGKAYGAKHILERAIKDVAHRPVEVTKERLEDTILHIESLAKRFNRVYSDGPAFILYDSQTDDAMVVTPMDGFYGVTTMYSNPNVQRRYGNPKWSGRNIQPPVEETGLKTKGISVRATETGDIVQSEVPKSFKQAKVITPNQIDEQAQALPRKTGTLSIKKKLSLTNAPPQGTFTTLVPNESAGKRLTDTINNVVNFFKSPEERLKTRIAFVDPNSGLSQRLQNQPIYDANGVLRADLLARGKAQTINIIRNGLQTGIPIVNSDGSIIIQRDDVNNLANSQAIADRLNDNQYVQDSGLDGRSYVAEVARALRAKEIMAEDAAFNKTQKNVKKHRNREKQIKPDQIKWAEQQLKDVPELTDIFDIWKNVNTGLLNLWEEVGLLDKKTADEYRSKKYYVSLAASNADLEEMMERQLGFTSAGLKSTPKIHKLKGSADLERNIWENIDKQYASMLAGAYQNQVRKIAVEQLIGAEAASIPSRIKNGKEVAAPLTEGINLRYKDPTNPLADHQGVVHVIVDNPVDLAAFESFHYELNPLMKFFGGATNVLRAGALLNPMFWIRQLIRDPIHAALVANSGITTPFHSAKEFINIIKQSSPEARILAERGVIGQYDSTIDLHSYLQQSGKEQLEQGKLHKMFHKLMQIHEASDAATRVAIFKKEKQAGLDKGMTEEEATNFAVMKARESINFMIHGNSKSLNALRQMIPFLSASITSLDTVYRAATGYGLPPAEKAAAKKLFKQRAALMLGSTMAYALLMQNDDEYKKLPDYVKDNNWLIKNPTGEGFIKVPVPYEVGFLFKTLPEVAIRYASGSSTGKEMIKSYYDGFMHNLPTGGVPVPQAVKPALEVITNYSFFTGNPIESIGEGRLPVEMRGRNASETAKFLSGAGLGAVGLSPAKIDALAQGYMAEAGTFGFWLADHLITTIQGKEPTSKNLAKQPFFKSFLTDPNSNKAVADFYQIEQTANQVAQEFSTMTKTGLGKEAVEFMQDEDKRKLMSSAPALRRIATAMTAIRKSIEATNNNQSISPDERREIVNKLTAQYNRVAEQGVKLANTLGIR